MPQTENMSLHDRITEEEHSVRTGSLVLQQSEKAIGEEKLFDIYEAKEESKAATGRNQPIP